MPTHVHLLIDPGHPDSASSAGDILRSIKLPVTQKAISWATAHSPASLASMAHTSPSGSITHRFWQRGGGFDRNLFERDAIRDMIDYIHQNPVTDGLCSRPEDWPWSSAITFRDHAKGVLTLNWESLSSL